MESELPNPDLEQPTMVCYRHPQLKPACAVPSVTAISALAAPFKLRSATSARSVSEPKKTGFLPAN